MARLEELTVGSRVVGLAGQEAVEIIAVRWIGDSALDVTWKNNHGALDNRILFSDDAGALSVQEGALPWSFDADPDDVRLVSEARRISLAYLYDPYLASRTSEIEPLPHQISAVYQEMLPRLPLRYVLADDPGAGKTIMTGLLLKELIVRGDLKRCLIVAPGSLCEQWQDELNAKFQLRFDLLTNDQFEAAVTGNVFAEKNFCIARLDKLARNDDLKEKLRSATDWDIVVVDEAHKMSASTRNGEVKYTKRFKLGQVLSEVARNLLLLTATPHNGKDAEFHLFLSLLDQERFGGVSRSSCQAVNVSDVMRRLVKEDLLKFDGTKLFPERLAYTVKYDLSRREADLYSRVVDYVREEFNRADNLSEERKNNVGFALSILQRRLASSPEAIYQSLRRRRERLEQRLNEERLGRKAEEYRSSFRWDDEFDGDDYSSEETEREEDNIADRATAAQTITELEAEINALKGLEKLANDVRNSGEDRKWDELSNLLQENAHMFSSEGRREKLIIFTEHVDTLRYLASKIRSLLGDADAVVTICGGMGRDDRRKVQERFREDKNVRILIATDAAGEGVNLQRAHLMINYDLPWNPNRLEQRFGRIHRIGQTEVCHLWNLVAYETMEGQVYLRLLEKLEEERKALGGKVFDVLGGIKFDNKSLRELLIEAIRYGDDQKISAQVDVVERSMKTEEFRRLINENALTEDVMDFSKVMEIRAEMERAEARKLQPHFIEAFFLQAFKKLGGVIHRRERGRYEISRVPFDVRNRDNLIGSGEHVLDCYERVCFEKDVRNLPGLIPALLICPGRSLLDSVTDLIIERYGDAFKRGAVFIDESDSSLEPRLLFYVENAIQDGVTLPNGNKRVVSRRVHFVEMKEDGSTVNAGYAPYLDYRSPTLEEKAASLEYVKGRKWLTQGVEKRVVEYAVTKIIPPWLQEVKERRTNALNKIEKAVNERMIAEIQYWDRRASNLREKEEAGKQSQRQTAAYARRRADEYDARMKKRLAEIAAERLIAPKPPVVVGCALVVPKRLALRLTGRIEPNTFGSDDRRGIELAAVNAVIEIERKLGFNPKDVGAEKRGYDVESAIPPSRQTDGFSLRFIEVKGRAKGAETVTVTKNEILTALNQREIGNYFLALVEVDGAKTRTIYLKNPFRVAPDSTATSVNYNIANLIRDAEVVYQG